MRMRHHVEFCLRNLVSTPTFQGKFSEEMERFWHNVEINYKRCGIPSGIPQQHIPIWWERAKDLKIPIEKVEGERLKIKDLGSPNLEPSNLQSSDPPKRGPGRPRKEQPVGV